MRVATWNVNSLRVRVGHVLDWAEEKKPDIVCLQETKTRDENFPVAVLGEAGYNAVYYGQPTYNGVAILSRTPAADVVTGLPNFDDVQKRVIAATIDGYRLVNLYVPNGKAVGTDKYHYKLEWFSHLARWLTDELEKHERIVVVGDFNVAPEDADVHDPEAWRGKILCSDAEREALKGLEALGFSDCFRQFEQPPESFSWWDYRAAAFRRNHGLRIDLIFANEAAAKACSACHIDREPRTWERPSDHTPVFADFDD